MRYLGSKKMETNRLFLRSSNMQEQKRLWEILMMPEVNKWYLTSLKKYANNLAHWSWENQEKFYKSKVDNANKGDVFTWSIFLKPEYTITEKEEVIGQIVVTESSIDDETTRDVGWFIDPNYQGKGYATEAAKAIIEYMFDEVGIYKISSCAVKDNISSCKVFEKLKFKQIGYEERESPYTFYDGNLVFAKYELDINNFKNMKWSDI